MNEGKPTKVKWWSRPRSSEDAFDGDFELARPRTAQGAAGDGPDGGDGDDFEPQRPAPAGEREHEGDYELHGPAVSPGTPTAHAGAAPGVIGTDQGDADAVPRPRTDAAPPAETSTAGNPTDVPSARDAADTPDAASASGTDDQDGARASDAPGADDVTASAPGAPRPTPLHEPDPYSTPPYGEPGPWAPAPPVQHPAATPAHGTAVPPAVTPPPADAPAAMITPPPHPGAPRPHPVTAPPPPGAPRPQDAPVPDPWQRYDPWAAAGPLQQTGAAAPAHGRRRGRTRRTLVTGILLIALVSGGVGGAVGVYLERHGGVGTVELPQAGKESADRDPGTVAGIAARALPGVVTLHVSGGGAAGTGTGFVLDGRGHILTNNHVVEPAGDGGEITVTFHSGDTAKATVVGRDSGYDLAVVEVKDVRGLTPMPLGNSDNVQVGDPVVAIGAPFDLAGTVTSGIISAKERPITAGGGEGDGSDVSYVDALQTDAPINPGNSGGPLLDSRGRVIGINSAIRSAGSESIEPEGGQSGSIGLGFAIPINQGKRVAEELINTGRATHPVIGITLDMSYTGDGARVGTEGSDGGPPVTVGGPGARAGLEAGDVITEVDGRRIHSGEELIVKTRAHRPGDRLELTVERDGRETNVSLVLGSSDDG
ncbi:trypsin-like peptidase domain-containing protein [Streptomyces sp. NPDC006367]|uniref:S1C family serine protease n=1 Tax=unclassified Streptomyces TaxID=2593676 RepID=UPI0033AE7B9D